MRRLSKSSNPFRYFLNMVATVAFGFLCAEAKAQSTPEYVAIYQVWVDQARVLKKCEVVKVFDPAHGDRPIDYKPTEKFHNEACRIFGARGPTFRFGKSAPTQANFFLDPLHPDSVIVR